MGADTAAAASLVRVGANPTREAGPAAADGEMCGVKQCFPTAGPGRLLAVAVPDASAASASADEAVAVAAGDPDNPAGVPLPAAPLWVVAPETGGGDREDPHAMPPG